MQGVSWETLCRNSTDSHVARTLLGSTGDLPNDSYYNEDSVLTKIVSVLARPWSWWDSKYSFGLRCRYIQGPKWKDTRIFIFSTRVEMMWEYTLQDARRSKTLGHSHMRLQMVIENIHYYNYIEWKPFSIIIYGWDFAISTKSAIQGKLQRRHKPAIFCPEGYESRVLQGASIIHGPFKRTIQGTPKGSMHILHTRRSLWAFQDHLHGNCRKVWHMHRGSCLLESIHPLFLFPYSFLPTWRLSLWFVVDWIWGVSLFWLQWQPFLQRQVLLCL